MTTAEERLMFAALEDGIRTLLGAHRAVPRSWRQQELAWLTSDDRTEPFAFARICEALGIDADRLRRRVLASCDTPSRADGRTEALQ